MQSLALKNGLFEQTTSVARPPVAKIVTIVWPGRDFARKVHRSGHIQSSRATDGQAFILQQRIDLLQHLSAGNVHSTIDGRAFQIAGYTRLTDTFGNRALSTVRSPERTHPKARYPNCWPVSLQRIRDAGLLGQVPGDVHGVAGIPKGLGPPRISQPVSSEARRSRISGVLPMTPASPSEMPPCVAVVLRPFVSCGMLGQFPGESGQG